MIDAEPIGRVRLRQHHARSIRSLREVTDGAFASWMGTDDWRPWTAFMCALRGEPLTPRELRIYRACTGRQELPSRPFKEGWAIVGRRGRKSATAAMLGVYAAVYCSWPHAPGESVRVLVVALSKDQAKIVREYCQAILESRPGLSRLIDKMDADSITLTNRIVIQCVANNFRSIRGPAVVCAIFDEVAYWFNENSQNPDTEVLRAVRPSMLTMPGAMLIGISSPYARKGLLYEKYKKHFGRDDPRVLVWKAKTEIMNPQVDPDEIAQEYENDPVAAAAEYGAEFRSDVESYVSRDAVEAVVSHGVRERAPRDGVRGKAFIDPAGGSGGSNADSMTLAIGHMEREVAVIDAVREIRPPFSPENVVTEFAGLLKLYHIMKIEGDHWGSEWCKEPFRKLGIAYEPTEKVKSMLYVDLLPAINSGKVDLIDNDRLINQLCALERKTARAGKDSISHPPNGHDDVCNAVAGVVSMLLSRRSTYDATMAWVCSDDEAEAYLEHWSTRGLRPHFGM